MISSQATASSFAGRLRKQIQQLPTHDPNDPDYRRRRYVRYADDFLLGLAGPRSEAEEIKVRLGEFLRDVLKLELSKTKTLITHARTETADCLGYDIGTFHDDTRRSINGAISLRVPVAVVRAKCNLYRRHGKPVHRPEMEHDSPYSIVVQYQQEYRGVVEYYQLAFDRYRFNRLKWIMSTSLARRSGTSCASGGSDRRARAARHIARAPRSQARSETH